MKILLNTFPCYSIIKHECHGSCQGSSWCPYCWGFKEGDTKKSVDVTRWVMLKFLFFEFFKQFYYIYLYEFKHKKAINEIVKKLYEELEKKK
jgi:hypothetical protein